MNSTDILINIRKIVRSINIESKRIQKDYGVSIPQVLFLNYLLKSPGFHASQKEIKNFLNLNSSTVSGIINRLERKGLIARLPKAGDKRLTTLILTSAGDDLIKKIPPLLHDRLSYNLQKVDNDELQNIENVLVQLVQILQISDVDASPVITNDIKL